MDDPHEMTNVDDISDAPEDLGGVSLGVASLGDNPVEKLEAGAELHDEVDRVPVLVRPLDLHDVRLPRQVLHYLNLPLHVVPVALPRQLPLQNRLAGVAFPRRVLGAEVGDPELPSSQLFPQSVVLLDVLEGPSQDRVLGNWVACWSRHFLLLLRRRRRLLWFWMVSFGLRSVFGWWESGFYFLGLLICRSRRRSNGNS